MSKFSRDKGKRGERKVIDWMQPIVNATLLQLHKKPILLQRDTRQWDAGGSDICGLDFLSIEVKNVEIQSKNDISKWWQQTLSQTKSGQTPILFYMKSRNDIRVRLMGAVGDSEAFIECQVDISLEDFEKWLVVKIEHNAEKLR